MPSKASFPRRRPALFIVLMIVAAVALLVGAMAVASFLSGDEGDEGGGLFAAKSRLGVVRLEGFLGDAEPAVRFMKELREDPTIKGVVLRINSPGGAFGPSQEIYQAVARLAAVKPVVASMSTVAASGGYYAACPAHRIFANPGTLTGSIGVMAQYPNVPSSWTRSGSPSSPWPAAISRPPGRLLRNSRRLTGPTWKASSRT